MPAIAIPAAMGATGAPALSSRPATRMQDPIKNFHFMDDELNAIP